MPSAADRFWAEFLGVDSEAWTTPGVSYRPHVGLLGFRGLWCFRRNDHVVVSAPMSWIPRLQELLSAWEPDRFMDQASLAHALGANFERSIGPAFQGHLPLERLKSAPAVPGIRKLQLKDERAVNLLRAACAPDWEISGLDAAGSWRHAYFERGTITAMAGYRARSDQAGDPCILTHPDFRGQQRGTAVTRAVVREALAHGKVLLYQTLESNSAAVRIALALGYERYATHIAVRLKNDSP